MNERTYSSISIHPADENGAQEVWATWEEDGGNMGVFDSDGIIGWLYRVDDIWVWMNEAGHPTRVFVDGEPDLSEWLLSLSPCVTWATEMRT